MITFNLLAEGYRIGVHWEGIPDSTIYLAHYYDSKIYINDTLKLNENAEGEFSGDSLLQQGLYLLYLNGSAYFDFLLGSDQNIRIKTNQEGLYKNLKISGARESVAFYKYQQTLREKSEEKKIINKSLPADNSTPSEEILLKLQKLDQEMQDYMSKEIAEAGNTMYGVFLRTASQITMPEPTVSRDHPKYDSIAWFQMYNYRRDHFLENIDFTDERILYTPILKSKLETYFNRILIQNPDTIIPQALHILAKSEPNKRMFQYTTQFLLNNSVQSKIMGMDAVFLAVADSVYLNGKATWADSTTLAKIKEEAYLTRQNILGNKAPDLIMENINGEFESLYLTQGKNTILVFYEYDCGHCKKDIPALYNDVYMKFLEHNIEVYAVCMNDDRQKWEEFVSKHELEGWHHLWDPSHQSKFRFKYNVKTAPTMYLLNQDKIIIAKRLDNTSLTKLLNALLN